ncbi:hypothetical protein [Lachnoclostridium sp.]|uniref:hypothetical protein n=1 Tax=Lachnoclostridium sp. TaxID=2028282 RepID=UPI0028A03F9F|nr:hypothetical protein [Lachnoclostridium sp.]
MKSKKSKVIYIIFFVAAAFFAAFILIEFHKDYLAVALAAVLMLIAAYFLVDKIEHDIYQKYQLDQCDFDDKFEQAMFEMKRNYTKIERLERAIYKAAGEESEEEVQSVSMLDILARLESFEKNIQKEQEENTKLLRHGIKALVQYSRENARQVALNTNENTQSTLKEINNVVSMLEGALPNLLKNNQLGLEEQIVTLNNEYHNEIKDMTNKLDQINNLLQGIVESDKKRIE